MSKWKTDDETTTVRRTVGFVQVVHDIKLMVFNSPANKYEAKYFGGLMGIKIGSFFSGVGGIDLGFEETGKFDVVYANEIDKYPVMTYEKNFKVPVDNRDIHEVKADEIPDFDVMVGGFPCQTFSIAGQRKGFNDETGRGTLFFELTRIIKEKKADGDQPKAVFFENVKNLVNHDKGNTMKVILASMESLGYKTAYKVLNACEYGNIPQNRERTYIVGFLDENEYESFQFPDKTPLTTKLSDVIDFNEKQDDKYYYHPDTCKFFDVMEKDIPTGSKGTYQWRWSYVRENKRGVCPTLTANMGTGGNNVPIIRDETGIRKLTPRECFRIQGFPDSFSLPEAMSNTRLYKQAGNSVAVPVIRRIATNMVDAMSDAKKNE